MAPSPHPIIFLKRRGRRKKNITKRKVRMRVIGIRARERPKEKTSATCGVRMSASHSVLHPKWQSILARLRVHTRNKLSREQRFQTYINVNAPTLKSSWFNTAESSSSVMPLSQLQTSVLPPLRMSQTFAHCTDALRIVRRRQQNEATQFHRMPRCSAQSEGCAKASVPMGREHLLNQAQDRRGSEPSRAKSSQTNCCKLRW